MISEGGNSITSERGVGRGRPRLAVRFIEACPSSLRLANAQSLGRRIVLGSVNQITIIRFGDVRGRSAVEKIWLCLRSPHWGIHP
jgi:hypothetical protein